MERLLLLLIVGLTQVLADVRTKREDFETLKNFGPSLGYRPPPPLVRREIFSRVKYDPEKWISEPQMTIVGAVMFDRATGLSVDECLDKCASPKFQNPQTRWICRSLTYDHKWHICDLFAIDGTQPPYYLAEYKHRDYFKYLAAQPPADKEFSNNPSKEMSAEVQVEEKKFESSRIVTTTSSFLNESEIITVSTSSQSLETTEPIQVKPSVQKEEDGLMNMTAIDSSKSKEENGAMNITVIDFFKSKEESGVKALASKQTGETSALEHLNNNKETLNVQSESNKIEYYKKPAFKFAIVPISTSKEQTTTSITTESSTSPITEAQQETTTKSSTFIQLEEEKSVTAEIVPITKEEKSAPKLKIQGITTYTGEKKKPFTTLCKAGEVARYFQIKKRDRTAKFVKRVDALELQECAEACTNEDSFQCKSAIFQSSSCLLFSDVADLSNPESLKQNEQSTYLERMCIPAQIGTNSNSISEAILNHILVGQVQEVTDAKTLLKCQLDCLTSLESLGFRCKSAMFYPSDIKEGQNCLLNSEDHYSKPIAFVTEDENVQMIYFTVSAEPDKKSAKKLLNLDSPIQKDDWTKWSKCQEHSDAIRYRYFKCSNRKDIRKCPKQSAMCKPPSLQIHKILKSKNECRAVMSKGRKLCPHGFRYDDRGMRRYCINPVDC